MQAHHNPSDLLCVEPDFYDESKHKQKVPFQQLNYLKNVSPMFVLQSLEWFCCSFVKLCSEEETDQQSKNNDVSAFDEEALEELSVQQTKHTVVYDKMQVDIKALKTFYGTIAMICPADF